MNEYGLIKPAPRGPAPDTAIDTGSTAPGKFVFQITLANKTVRRVRGDRSEMGTSKTAVYLDGGDGQPSEEVYAARSGAIDDLIRLDAEVAVPAAEDTTPARMALEQMQARETELKKELASLTRRLNARERDAAKLNALEAAGVDNWEHYDEAMREAEEAQEYGV